MDETVQEEEDFPGRLLHQAALWDNAELLEDLLHGEQIAHIDSQDSWGRTPLHAAATTDKSRCLTVLLEAGANVNIPCGPRGENRTPLHVSAEHGHVSNVLQLLKHRADLLHIDRQGLSARKLAERGGHRDVATVLKDAADTKHTVRQEAHAQLRELVQNGDVEQVRALLNDLASDATLVLNMAPNGSNTLLFLACELGFEDMVKLLLEFGSDGRIHPVTRYSPLYIACFKGRKNIVKLLLKRFPEMVQQSTVEDWLPFHAACINGHLAIAEKLLKHSYPQHVMLSFRNSTDTLEYEMPFDINMKDRTGQNALYVACVLGNSKMVDLLLKFKVPARRIESKTQQGTNQSQGGMGSKDGGGDAEARSPTKRRISDGIHSIMTRLIKLPSTQKDSSSESEELISPLLLNERCNANSESALQAAVRGKHKDIVKALLLEGADPNVTSQEHHSDQLQQGELEEEGRCTASKSSGLSSPLVEACRNRDLNLVDLLVKHNARDDDCRALKVAVRNGDNIIISRLLSIKSYHDREGEINKKVMSKNFPPAAQFSGFGLTYSSMFPKTPTMINWHCLRCGLTQINPRWLVDAALWVNPKLKLNPKHQEVALYAITRLDLSDNELSWLPPEVLQLHSLRYLNLAQNKIEKLPEGLRKNDLVVKSRGKAKDDALEYNAPLLEELYLQDNNLEYIPEAVFGLPALVTLDVTNNRLTSLPFAMWRSPRLKELNVSFNLLNDLPTTPPQVKDLDNLSVSSSDSNRSVDRVATELSAIAIEAYDYSNLLSPAEEAFTDCRALYASFANSKSLRQLELKHQNMWSRTVEVMEKIPHTEAVEEGCSQLSSINLSHNKFTSIPSALPCLALNLTRLNMAYNNLRSMAHVTSYPNSLRHLDLSHNEICCWPSLPQVDGLDRAIICHAPGQETAKPSVPKLPVLPGRRSLRSVIMESVCTHRRHLRLDNLRTLIVAGNKLTRIQLSTDDDGFFNDEEDVEKDHINAPPPPPLASKSRLMMPNLSMLDLSKNHLKEIPHNVHELNNLSVLNISDNPDVNELAPQMGLLSRLWNLNTRGCNLQEPLKSMIDSKKFKTTDVIGYLKSVLEDARPYARMKLMIVGIQGIGKTSLLEQLRQEGGGTFRKKAVEHWGKRVGNKNINLKTSRGVNMSTVGVDIGDWVYDKKTRGQSPYGPVVFRTWDFAGQREYYATHQYFLSKRSVYLVVWKITDGRRGVEEILQWLVNIQARAPNSPVIIVGTHYDQMREHQTPSISEDLQQIIRDKFINIVDAEKCGLPRVLDTIEVSCKTRHNIKLLCNLIYDTAFSLRSPGSKQLLLEQRIPASYLMLEDVVGQLASERRQLGLDPVLNAEQYKEVVAKEMHSRHGRTFRDSSELNQATLFLHENGVLLHYDDATLKDLYFLDPQWLCDMLAHVVTIREINPFARTGVMKLDDLEHLFKSSAIGPMDARSYTVSLLNKFEVGLTWDSRTLLIPSLLPCEEDLRADGQGVQLVRIPVRSRGWAMRTKKSANSSSPERSRLVPVHGYPHAPSSPSVETAVEAECESANSGWEWENKTDPETSIIRLLLMAYFPCGFWSRLMTRLLADYAVVDIARSFFVLPEGIDTETQLSEILGSSAEWVLWQTGLELRYGDTTLFRMKEVLSNAPFFRSGPVDYRQLRLRLKQEGIWSDVDLTSSSILEIYFPVNTVMIRHPVALKADTNTQNLNDKKIVLTPSKKYVTKLLALVVDHIDTLLEDWYPTLGTRFVHTSEGRFLVTRLIPCPRCLASVVDSDHSTPARRTDVWEHVPYGVKRPGIHVSQQNNVRVFTRKSQESCTSDCDSGVEPDSNGSSRNPSIEDRPKVLEEEEAPVQYSWMVEECILKSFGNEVVNCPLHGDISLGTVAPDAIFLDLLSDLLWKPTALKVGRLLGQGGYGFVYEAEYLTESKERRYVAMKVLQPYLTNKRDQSLVVAYNTAQGKWDRDPLRYSTKAYCNARQEMNILRSLQHPHIINLLGLITNPLALLVQLAPQGDMSRILSTYRRSGARLQSFTIEAIIIQTARALEYLHQQHIIYKDLKAENVLVWAMPLPSEIQPRDNVLIKLADYGVSRITLPTGSKGFGGTEGFMAPEIIRYNGEEEFTEKVDCFSFGMFMYEMLTLRSPFEGHESVKESILEGGRPFLTYRDTHYPSYMLDLMTLCWSQQPTDRPTASQVVSIACDPQFTHLYDVVSLDHSEPMMASVSTPLLSEGDDSVMGLWMARGTRDVDLLLASPSSWLQYYRLEAGLGLTAACQVGGAVWLGDVTGHLHAFSTTDCSHLFSYFLDADSISPGSVCCLVPLPPLSRVAVGLSNGRLFLVRSDVLPAAPSMAEGSFVMAELGSSTELFSLTAVFSEEDSICELWCGEPRGQISVYTIYDNIVTNHETVNHGDLKAPNAEVRHVASSQDDNSVWSTVYPGCVLYRWVPKQREIATKLDCSKLIPCRDWTMDWDMCSPMECHVTSLAVLNTEVYIGTNRGCVIVVNGLNLHPITVFRPFEEDVYSIIPLNPGPNQEPVRPESAQSETHPSAEPASSGPLIAAVGRGYRCLLDQYRNSFSSSAPGVGYQKHSNRLKHTFALLFRAEDWHLM